VSAEDIKSANRGLNPRRLRIGQQLVIPTSLGEGRGSAAATRSRVRSPRLAYAPSRLPASARPTPSAARASALSGTRPAGTIRHVHIVRYGETLWKIAVDFHVPLAALMRENGLTARTRLRVGQGVRIPGETR
jgi:LysM repeat protein